jgi:hypothetical protein
MPHIETDVLIDEEALKHVVGSFLHIEDQCFKLDEVHGWVEDMKAVNVADIEKHIATNVRRARKLRIKMRITPLVKRLIKGLEER